MHNTNLHSSRWALTFFTLWTGQALSLLGSRIASFAVIWWMTETTGSAVVLTTLAFVAMVPQVFLGPIGGVLVDRWNRRLIMLVADSAIAISTGILAYLAWTGTLQLWQVYIATFISATGGIIHFTAMLASTSLMVPEEHLPRIQGANQMLQGAMGIVAPPLGALLVSILPLHVILGMDVVTAAFAIIPLLFISIPQPTVQRQPESATESTIWGDVRFGLSYIWSWKGLLVIIAGGMLLNLLTRPVFTLLPILVTQHYAGGAAELGWMEALLGVGIILGGLLLSIWGGFRRRVLAIPIGVLIIGAGILMVGNMPPTLFYVALTGMAVIGIGISAVDGTMMAIIQSTVDPDVQGRVFTVLASGAQAMSPLGLLIAGPAVDSLGAPIWFAIAGVASLLMGSTLFFIPAVMQLEKECFVEEKESEVPQEERVEAVLA